jgi:hypothetical protein
MEEKDFLEKLTYADSITNIDERINYLNSIQTDFSKIKEQDINLSKLSFEDRKNNVSLRLANLDNAYFDYVLRTKIFLASLEKSE